MHIFCWPADVASWAHSDRYCGAAICPELGVERAHAEEVFEPFTPPKCQSLSEPIYACMGQYSSASMMVMTRLVTAGSAGSGE